MASTYTTSLQIQKIGTGEQSGIWGATTNTNWDLIEQAVAGVQNITMLNADYTLTVVNGASDEARNMVIVAGGTNSAIRKIIAPLAPKVYIVNNNTSGGYAITIGGSTGSVVTIPSGATLTVYCDGTSFYTGASGAGGNFNIPGNLTVSGSITGSTASFSGAISSVSPAFTGTPTAPTASAGTNTTQIATTAFVQASTAALGLGTMATQNSNNVSITGGTITGATISSLGSPLGVASGGTGASSLTANSVLVGNGTSAVGGVAPSSNGQCLRSNGTSWYSSKLGLGISGEVWNDVLASRSATTVYTNSRTYPISVSATVRANAGGSMGATLYIDGIYVSSCTGTAPNGSGYSVTITGIVPAGSSYHIDTGGTSSPSLSVWAELY